MPDLCARKSLRAELRKLRLLRHNAGVLLGWLLGGLLCATLLWAGTLSRLRHEQDAITDKAFREASSLSQAYAEQLARSAELIDRTTLSLKYYWQRTPGGIDLQDQALHGLYSMTSMMHVSIFNRDGRLITSTFESGRRNFSIIDREGFLFHKGSRTSSMLISGPEFSPRLGKTIIRFTRRLETRDGTFGGIVSVPTEPAYLGAFTDHYSLGKGDFIAVMKDDGAVLFRREGYRADAPPLAFDSQRILNRADGGLITMSRDKFTDRQARIMAWSKAKDFPLIAVIGLSRENIQDAHATLRRGHYQFALFGTLLLALMAAGGIFMSSRLAWRKYQADEVKRTFRLATDSAREGFYMTRPLYDEHGKIIDFLVEDCNERGAAYYRTTSANLIGSTFSCFTSGRYFQHVMGVFRKAMEDGFYEDEFEVEPESPLTCAWVHRKLIRSGDGLAVTLRDVSEVKAHEQALSELANADAVTRLPNRHWLMHYLPGAVEQARQNNTAFALLFVDLDDFKNVNDTLGHAAGDELLRAAASRLKMVLRPQDNVVRLGGDEFTIVLEDAEDAASVSRIAERIIASLGQPFALAAGDAHAVHASIGISLFPQHGDDPETLLKHADIAMYAAKANGKGQYQFFRSKLSENLVARLSKEQALRRAIERDEFVLYYQPRVDTLSGELRSMEALVRWSHPELGMVPPNEFIAMAEHTGLIGKLGELVIAKACMQLAQWKAQRLPVVPVSINVSPRQFNQGDLASLFSARMAEHDIEAALIEVEITESCMIGEDTAAAGQLAALEALGMKLLVDDFGTGYSSLSQLQRLDMDVLKVDRAFTAQLDSGREGEVFFMAILSMAHVLGMSVVAEGVETVEQLRALQALSCNEVQGYLISRPVPASGVPAMLEKRFLFSHA